LASLVIILFRRRESNIQEYTIESLLEGDDDDDDEDDPLIQ
jgi:hypothetical protein